MTTITEFDRIVTVDLEQLGKIVGVQVPIGEYPPPGGLDDSENLWIVYMLEHNFPEPECKNFDYFRTNYWFNFTDETFVKVESEQPNEYAVYDPATKTWGWDAALVLMEMNSRSFILIAANKCIWKLSALGRLATAKLIDLSFNNLAINYLPVLQ